MWSHALSGPSGLTANVTSNITNLSTVVQWDVVDDSLTITNYTVTWTSEANPVDSDTLTEQSSYTITGLTFDTVYTITVTAANRCGNGPVFTTSISFPADTTSTTSSISPTVTANTNPMTTNAATSTTTVITITDTAISSNTIPTTTTKLNPTTTNAVMNPSTTATISMTTTVSRDTDTTSSTVKTTSLITTTG